MMNNGIFNILIKEKFLSMYNIDTSRVYRTIFTRSNALEQELNKDLNEFDESEFETFMKDYLKPKTKDSARSYCNVLSAYVQWSIDNNHNTKNINIIERRQDYYYKFIQKHKQYMSKMELDQILSNIINEQDEFMLLALFEGIEGKQLNDLISLKISDFNKESHTVLLESGRTATISNELLELAIEANKQSLYFKKNGAVDEKAGSFEFRGAIQTTSELSHTEYILKSSLVKHVTVGKLSHHTLHSRIKVIKWFIETFISDKYKDAITTKNLMRSGMIYKAYQIYKDKGDFTVDDAKVICKSYGVNYKWTLVEDFLNVNMIKELYL